MSQYLVRVNELLKLETEVSQRAELVAKRAAYLARTGRFDDARKDIAQVREIFGDGRSGRVMALVMLAEGLALHFEQLSSGAIDRVTRAQLIATAIGDQELIAITSAWRGHLEFEESAFAPAINSIGQALLSASDDDHATRARCAIVLFNAFALCGDTTSSQRWFLRGRDHALKEGDQASLDALLHSRAAFGVARIWIQQCEGSATETSLGRARIELESARNLQALAHIEAHSNYIKLCDARLAMVEGQFRGAAGILADLIGQGPFPHGHFSPDFASLALAFCQCKFGDLDAALSTFKDAKREALVELDVDDRLCVAWMLLELTRMDARFGDQEAIGQQLSNAKDEFDESQRTLRELLHGVEPS